MDLKNALLSVIKPHVDDELAPLSTPFGEDLSSRYVLTEYPRPQMRREKYINLNGKWDYCISTVKGFPENYDGKILVPFSPEAALSGVNRQLKPDEYLWYHRLLPIQGEDLLHNNRLLLHFGAIDYEAEVFVNSTKVITHYGGYLPFDIDITDALLHEGNEIFIRVHDPSDEGLQTRGKQTLSRGGIFYTAQSGIWQTVWMEWVPATHIEKVTPHIDYDKREVTLEVDTILYDALPTMTLSVSMDTVRGRKHIPKEIFHQIIPLETNIAMVHQGEAQYRTYELKFTLSQEHLRSWTPENPFLYDVTVTLSFDKVRTYFAMRKYSLEKKNDIPFFCLNNKPYFLMGALDQGYWADGLYTAPSDEALLYDIKAMKTLGFNTLRKHLKVESARWYYHCDKQGMIVIQDMINGGEKYHMPLISYLPTLFPKAASMVSDNNYKLLARLDEDARDEWSLECMEMIEYLKFFPSIAIWCPFNEGFGQFDSGEITDAIRKADPERLIDSASGWFDQGCGDFISVHNYFRPLKVSVKSWDQRAFSLSEFGGYSCRIEDHSSVARIFGYKRFSDLKSYAEAIQTLLNKDLFPLREKGLSCAVFTQVSDVEEEVNGILTYDRKINKLEGYEGIFSPPHEI